MKKKFVEILFIIISVIHILSIAFDINSIQLLTKPFIILSLIFLYKLSVKKVNKWYVIALIFSFLGDVLLLDKLNYFIYGIAAFLITQLLYIKIVKGQLISSKLGVKLIALVPFIIYFFVLISLLRDNLKELLYPVVIYGITISIFGTVSLLNYLLHKNKHALGLLFGAIFFITSDSMIAFNKFYLTKPYYGILIMITYIIAQYLIYKFMVSNDKKLFEHI